MFCFFCQVQEAVNSAKQEPEKLWKQLRAADIMGDCLTIISKTEMNLALNMTEVMKMGSCDDCEIHRSVEGTIKFRDWFAVACKDVLAGLRSKRAGE